MPQPSVALIGQSEAIGEVRHYIALAARTEIPVLLVGEPGTGKDLAARLLHGLSKRRDRPFLQLSLSTIPDSLAASELFGYEQGAFTGAKAKRAGLLEHGNGGTILLDAVDEMSVATQLLILRFAQDGEFRPLGASTSRQADVRIISSTSANLPSLVTSGKFRADLYYRLNGFMIRMPPLRERREDIPLLASHFLALSKQKPLELAPDALQALNAYDFPGNVSELRSILQRAAAVETSSTIEAKTLKLFLAKAPERQTNSASLASKLEAANSSLEALRREMEALRATSIAARPIWQGRSFQTLHDYCFVLMPFGDAFRLQGVYKDHVKPAVERCGLRCERADDIYNVSGVMQSVWESINRARLLIADLTDRNPNVFYELGIAHTLGKPVVMISQSINFVPFDLRHLRCFVYEYTPKGAKALEDALERTIKNLLSNSADLNP